MVSNFKKILFKLEDFIPVDACITEEELWDNYAYFIKAVIPYAERHGIQLALHPDDPPLPYLGNVGRIMTNYENIKKAIYDICPSDMLGITMCQANYYIMGEDLDKVITELRDKIFFVHFRNTKGTVESFRETFHDNGDLNMAQLMALYKRLDIDVPIRVDHVPTMKDENTDVAGYAAIGRYFAIGYLKGILDATK